jgi:hypothetical protein
MEEGVQDKGEIADCVLVMIEGILVHAFAEAHKIVCLKFNLNL